MRKALRFYLVASTMMSSIALAGKEEYLQDLDKQGLRVLLKAVTHKCDVSWEEEFNLNDQQDDARATWVNNYIDEFLGEKSRNYYFQMSKILGGRQNPEFVRLENKYKKVCAKRDTLMHSRSQWFIANSYNQNKQVSTIVVGNSSRASDLPIDEFDEKALKVAIQVLTNKKNKDAIYAEQLDLHNLEDQIRKENIEKLFELLSKNKGVSSYEKSRYKISVQIESLSNELSYLPQQLLEIESRVRVAQIERREKLEDFRQRRQDLPKKVAAEQYLNELNLLDGFFLTQIREDHATSRRHDKDIIPPDASLYDAMGIYAESVMSITKVMKTNGYVIGLIERALNLFQGEGAVSFQVASKRISDKAIELGYPQIRLHFEGDHLYFPLFEKLTSIYCQLVGDPSTLVYSQQNACKNGLYGRIVFSALLAFKDQLAQGINNPSQLPVAFDGNFLNDAGFKEALLQIQREEDADEGDFLNFCQRAAIDKENVQKLIFAKEEELKNLAAAMAKIPLSQPSTVKPSSSLSSSEFEVAPRTFRTTGANPSAKNKHSAISIQLSNQELRDAAYELIVNHRTIEKGPLVRVFNPKGGEYIGLGSLPLSLKFNDTVFNLSSWVGAVRDEPFAESVISTYLSFVGGQSDIHSFKIQSVGGILKEVVFGDHISESQAGIYVFAPEKADKNANEWSEAKVEDINQ